MPKLDDFAPDERKSFDGDVEMLSSDDYRHQIKISLEANGSVEFLDEAPLIPVTDDHNKALKPDDFTPDQRDLDDDVEILSSDEYRYQIKSNLTAHGNIECLDEAPFSTGADDHNNSVEGEDTIHKLTDKALLQAEEITRTLDSVEQIMQSIQEVAINPTLAAVAHTNSNNAEAEGLVTPIQSIFNLQEIVAQTVNKVKQIGESSQQISKVAFLINQLALQTNVLAININIAAKRVGEEGRFTTVAEEVGQLAAKSSLATQELEQIVKNIQLETSEVVRTMELEIMQVIEEISTKLEHKRDSEII